MLGDDVLAQLPGLQAHAESLMRDSCTIRRKSGTRFDATTGRTRETFETVYTGPCRLRMPSASVSAQATGRVEWSMQTSTLSLPAKAGADVRTDDIATIDASVVGHLTGRQYAIQSTPGTTLASAARYAVREVTY